jgi:hypothetical protein
MEERMASEKDMQVESDAAYLGPLAEAVVTDPASQIAEAEALSSLLLQMRRRLELRRKYLAFAAAFVAMLLLIAFAWLPAYSVDVGGGDYVVGYLVPLSVLLGFVLLQLALAYVGSSEIAFEATTAREYLDKAAEDARYAVGYKSGLVEGGVAEAGLKSRADDDVGREAFAAVRRAP